MMGEDKLHEKWRENMIRRIEHWTERWQKLHHELRVIEYEIMQQCGGEFVSTKTHVRERAEDLLDFLRPDD
jgi:hypothetical protein